MADTFDLYFQAKDSENLTGFKFFTFGFSRTIAVRGFWKLICLWLRTFMTSKGTDPLRPNAGTDFPNLIGANVTSWGDIRDVVLLSIQECNDQIDELQRTTQPDLDETLNTAVLSSFNALGNDGFEVYVTISNLAEESVQVRLPDLATRD